MLEARNLTASSPWVFASEDGLRPLSIFTLDDQHSRTRKLLKLGKEFVVHSLRHTFGTRMGEAGADAFEIKRLMGHSSVTVSQRYVHPSPESLERAFERLESMNEKAVRRLPERTKVQSVPTKVTTPKDESERRVS